MNPLRFETNDIVRLKEGAKYQVYRIDKGVNNIYRIEASNADAVRLGYIFDLVPYWDIEPLPIGGKLDKYVYLDVVVAASTVEDASQAPIRTIDKTYFVDALKKIIVGDEKTLFDEYQQHDFQYVHEVQHWLRKKGYLDLRIDENKLMITTLNKMKQKEPEDYMRLAVEVMKESKQERRNDTKISPLVGAVLVKPDGEVVTAYRSELREGDHAEFTLIERKCRAQRLEGSVLYATLEPCAPGARHFPKLSCAERIVNARIKKVYVGIEDPDYTVAGKGRKYLQDNDVEVELFPKELQDEITTVNEQFLEQARLRSRLAKEEQSEVLLSEKENVVPVAVFDDLREDLLKQYLENLGIKEDIRSGYATRLFLQAGMLGMVGEKLVPTGLGMLVFGKHPEVMYPHEQIRATLALEGRQESIKTFKGALLDLPDQVQKWFENVIGNQLDRSHAKREVVYDYPMTVIREIVINAILHRDYDIEGANTQIVVTDDAIEIKSPGMPVSPLTIQMMQSFSAPTVSRNPKIINIFDVFDLAEQRGLGFKTVRELPEKYHIPLPIVTVEDPYMVITLPRKYEAEMAGTKLSKREIQILDYVRLHGTVTRQQCQNAMQISERTANRVLKDLVDAGYLDPQGESTSTKYVLKEISRQNS